ncbi:MAG: hypothetical protein BGO96_04545 [Micrococcales bacterium 73-15]|nr:MAG: hypothetical protein BGO96_04545 [Micrococcales bacterium 73-15]
MSVATPPLALTAADSHTELRRIVEHSILNAPRSLQRRIGPSEIGTPCDHCLAAKIAGWEETSRGVAWLPFIGTCVHHEHEYVLTLDNAARRVQGQPARWLVEHEVTVGTINGVEITGSCDAYDTLTGTTVDWKIVGPSTLRSARRGPSPVYRAQAHLYGRGLVAQGHQVRHVSIVYLPRNSVNGWDDAVLWSEPYDETVALTALARADRIARNLTAVELVGGATARDDYIRTLPREERCYSCARYPDAPVGSTTPGHRPQGSDLDGLLLP